MSKQDVRPVLQEIEYGKIIVHLNKIMEENDISTYQLSTKTNIRFQTIQALRKNESCRIDFEVLSKICYALNCKVEDIIEYEPN